MKEHPPGDSQPLVQEQSDELLDRRRNYRIDVPDSDIPVRGELQLVDGTVIPVEVINYSVSGLFCYGPRDLPLQENDVLDRIRLLFRRKPTVEFSGEVVRIQKNADNVFCGIRFFDRSRKPAAAPAPQKTRKPGEITDEMKSRWIDKIHSVPNYFRVSNIDEQMKAERIAYSAFEDLTENFTVEERWWFYEMLDELKRKEPFYPPRLLHEFILVCEYGYSAIPARPDWQSGKVTFLDWICNVYQGIKLFLKRGFGHG
ncbi:MAG: PilZ domain-containing protein [candidate division KSB1 bacterium]|nr:PilZ domain-containing protein [candidate division KSB1 bacterium]MDQ7063482.1 PilZ domain-containing protein [candidate division KSB1 bacterium]